MVIKADIAAFHGRRIAKSGVGGSPPEGLNALQIWGAGWPLPPFLPGSTGP